MNNFFIPGGRGGGLPYERDGNACREQPRPPFPLQRPHSFSKGKGVRVVCPSRSWFVYAPGRKQTNLATDKLGERFRKCYKKPCYKETSAGRVIVQMYVNSNRTVYKNLIG